MTGAPGAVSREYRELREAWSQHGEKNVASFTDGAASFIPNLLPETAVELGTAETLEILSARLGDAGAAALDPAHCDPEVPVAELPSALSSPASGQPDGSWLRYSNMVGINVRTVGTFWNAVKYLLAVPGTIDSVHLLPIWEPGVVDSLYGMASWQLNTEFFSAELAEEVPHLDTVERQLRAVINLIHASGRTVGMDVIPHTDRYAEMSLGRPAFFEWLRRDGFRIVDHRDELHREVEQVILDWLDDEGPATDEIPYPTDPVEFFGERLSEPERLQVLFGPPDDRAGRNQRRGRLVRRLATAGYEPVPATMGTPFRGIEVDPRDEARVIDSEGLTWCDYVITEPLSMSRVFNPLARYKLYGRKDDNRDWEIDFDVPRPEVWDYVVGKYADIQRRYGFDFMRGDMSHVQMRPDGVPRKLDRYYDLLGTVKNEIRRNVPYFGYFAETFLPARDVFGFGEEMDHLEAADADTTQGDLQSTVVGTYDFISRFRQYLDLAATRTVTPAFTVMTPDKDDPRFDEFYVKGNEVRTFVSYFLTDIPSYVGLGFETRDPHLEPWPNEHYTKLFVFHEHGESNVYPSKARHGTRFLWGKNGRLFRDLTRLRLYADRIFAGIAGRPVRWLLLPDARVYRRELAWTQADRPEFVFVANLDTEQASGYFAIPALPEVGTGATLTAEFSTGGDIPDIDRVLIGNGHHYRVESLAPGEGRVYRVAPG